MRRAPTFAVAASRRTSRSGGTMRCSRRLLPRGQFACCCATWRPAAPALAGVDRGAGGRSS
eukprot:3736153-Alexandrium_andersonii.AAC.1